MNGTESLPDPAFFAGRGPQVQPRGLVGWLQDLDLVTAEAFGGFVDEASQVAEGRQGVGPGLREEEFSARDGALPGDGRVVACCPG